VRLQAVGEHQQAAQQRLVDLGGELAVVRKAVGCLVV
jgi:hypothetical protein